MSDGETSSSLGQRVTLGTIWIIAAQILLRSIGLISTLILARLLVPEQFGIVAVAVTLMQLLMNMTDIGIAQTVIKYRDGGGRFLDALFSISLLRGFLVSVLLVVAAMLAPLFYPNALTATAIFGIAPAPLLIGLMNPRFHEFERDLDFSKKFVQKVGAKLCGVAAGVIVALIFRNFWAILAGILVSCLIETILSYVLRPYRPRFSVEIKFNELRFMGWLTAVSFVVAINNKIDTLLLPRLTGDSDTGNFYIGTQLVDLATLELPVPVATAMYPALSELQENLKEMTRVFIQGAEILAAIGFPVALGCAFVAPELTTVFLGTGWDEVAWLMQLLIPFQMLLIVFVPLQGFVMARSRMKLILMREIVLLVLKIPVFLWAAIHYGLPGAAVVAAGGSVLRWIANIFIFKAVSGERAMVLFWTIRRTVIACGVMALYFTAASFLPERFSDLPPLVLLLIHVPVAAALYTGVHLLLWQREGKPDGFERRVIDFLKAWRAERLRPVGEA